MITWRIYLEVDVLADHALQHIAVALDRAVEVDGAVLEYLAATEGPQLAGEGRGAVAGLLDR